jgi:CrcB protein
VQQLIFIAAGGALGAIMRFGVSNGVHALVGRDFPYGTLTVNVLGSLLIGICYIALIERLSLGPEWRAFIIIGILGAFTTFSTFSLETFNLVENGELIKAAVNVLTSITVCLLATWIGILIARQI